MTCCVARIFVSIMKIPGELCGCLQTGKFTTKFKMEYRSKKIPYPTSFGKMSFIGLGNDP